MSRPASPWTVESLSAALTARSEEFGITVKTSEGSEVLEVCLAAAGDFQLHIVINDEQIVTSALLWPRDEQKDPEAFEAMMLRSHKVLLPLCALSIDTINGRDYYDLFGAVSKEASIEDIMMECSMIADAALELAEDVGPGAQN